MGASSSTPEDKLSVELLEIAPSTTATARGGPSSSSSSSSQPRATQSVRLAKEAGPALKKYFPSKKPLNLITIWGEARTGKSFFMNTLVAPENDGSNTSSGKDVFAVAGGSRPCTVGASISTTTRSIEQISSSSSPPLPPAAGGERRWIGWSPFEQPSPGEPEPGQQPDIGFVDVEGQGDNGELYDTKLVTPLLLLSKVVIYNWKGLPTRATMLDKLSAMTYAASLLSPEEREDSFGHLIILLRDVSSTEEQSAHNRIFGREDETAPNSSAGDALKERNEKRKLLEQSFRSTRVCCLPSPHRDIDGEREIPQAEVSAEFAEKVSELRRTLATDLLEPHRFGDRPIEGGVALATLLAKVCEAANDGSNDLVPRSMMESVHVERAERAYQESKEVFYDTLSHLGVDSPKSKADTTKLLGKATSTAVECYTRETQSLVRDAVFRGREMLDVAIAQRAGECYDRQEDQVDAAQAEVDGLIDQAHTRHVDVQLVAIRRGLPMSKQQLKSAWNGMCTKLHDKLRGDVVKKVDAYKDLRGDLPPLLTLAAFKNSIQGKLDLLLNENDRLVAKRAEAERIKKAIQQARDQQASWLAELRQQEAEAQMLREETRRGRERRWRGYSPSSSVRYDNTLSPPPTRRDHTLSPPHNRRSRYDHTLSPPPTRRDHTLSPPHNRRSRYDHTLSPPPPRRDHTLSPPHTRRDHTLSPPPTRRDHTLSPPRNRRTRRDTFEANASATHDVDVGPIRNQAHAERRASEYFAEHPDQEVEWAMDEREGNIIHRRTRQTYA
ncbi:unnamed protein product [Scytosiphon promiscuus]